MGIFTLGDGTRLEQFDNFDSIEQVIIPDKTQLQCEVIKAGWDINNDMILVILNVIQEGKYKGFKNEHKLRLNDINITKANKAKSMLMAYDTNGKGLINKYDKAGKEITDDVISNSLVESKIIASFGVYPKTDRITYEVIKDDNGNTVPGGNWVYAISPIKKQIENQKIEENVKQKDDDFDDLDIPF